MGKIVIIVGSPTAKSRLNGVLNRVSEQLAGAAHEVDWIHVRELPAEDVLHARYDSQAIKQANLQVEQADAVVIATPVYKASYTGLLKAYLDLLPQKALERKVILPIVIGGTVAHLLAIDYALKPVLSALGTRYILSGVFVQDSQVQWREDGTAAIDAEALSRIDGAANQLAEDTAWFAARGEKELQV